MPKPFYISEFLNKTAKTQGKVKVTAPNGGVSYDLSDKVVDIPVSLHPAGGQEAEFAGKLTAEATDAAVTDRFVQVDPGDVLVIDGVTYDIVYWEFPDQYVGSYFAFYLKAQRA